MILVTHDPDEAYTLGERTIIYSAGKISQAGSPLEVRANRIIKGADRVHRTSAVGRV